MVFRGAIFTVNVTDAGYEISNRRWPGRAIVAPMTAHDLRRVISSHRPPATEIDTEAGWLWAAAQQRGQLAD